MPQPEKDVLYVGDQPLTIDDVVKVSRYRAQIALHPNSIAKMQQSRAYVEQLLQSKKAVYGLTTGFGKFSSTYISSEDAKELQLNLIRSHACGVGPPFPEETVRAMMLLRISALALGYSGVRHETVQTMVDMLNKEVIPVIPEQGSLGASGDLAPLSHLSLVLIGEGEAWHRGERIPGDQAMQAAGIAPMELAEKEGLALINGTQAMTAVGALACRDAEDLALWADAAAALTCEALRGGARRVRSGDARHPPARRAAAIRAQYKQADGRQRADDFAGRNPHPRRVFAALHPAGARREPRRHQLHRGEARDRDQLRDR
jgi:histidine ammonia-lyase